MAIIHLLDRALTRLVVALLILFFALMLGIDVLQLILRWGFKSGLVWGDVAVRNMVIWVGFFGAYLATREDRHFHIDLLTRFISPMQRRWFGALSDLFAAVVCYFLIRAGWTFVTDAIDPEAIAFLGIPQRYLAMIVPFGFGLIMLQFLLRTIEHVANGLRGIPLEERPA